MKHSWVVDGEGYRNCELTPLEDYGEGTWATCELLEDGLTVRMSGDFGFDEFYGNLRKPLLSMGPIAYEVARYEPKNLDSDAGPIDYISTPRFTPIMECRQEKNAFDGRARWCPQMAPAIDGDREF